MVQLVLMLLFLFGMFFVVGFLLQGLREIFGKVDEPKPERQEDALHELTREMAALRRELAELKREQGRSTSMRE